MHILPLLVLVLQNSKSDKVGYGNLGLITIILAGFSTFLTALEVCILQCYENRNINLEMRAKLRSGTRLNDLFKATGLGVILTTTSLLLGIYAFDK